MKVINDFDLKLVPQHKIVFVLTSEPDYEMGRLIFAEDWPEFDQFALIEGGHCSCYGFDDTRWEATIVNRDELDKILAGWIDHGVELEQKFALVVIGNF